MNDARSESPAAQDRCSLLSGRPLCTHLPERPGCTDWQRTSSASGRRAPPPSGNGAVVTTKVQNFQAKTLTVFGLKSMITSYSSAKEGL